MLQLKKLGWLAIWAFALVACDDSSGNGGNGDLMDAAGRDMAIVERSDMLPDAPDIGGGGGEDAEAPEPDAAPQAATQLQIVGDANPAIFVGQELALVVRYLSASDSPIADAEITAQMIDSMGVDRTAVGIEGSQLEAAVAVTNDDGEARFTLQAGGSPVSFTIVASAEGAEPAQWRITVDKDPEGWAHVRVRYLPADGRYPLEAVESASVALYQIGCAQLAQLLPEPLADLPLIEAFDGDDVAESGLLPEGATLSAVAYGLSATGVALATGCVDGIEIVGGQTAEATVVLGDLPLEFKGRFAVDHVLDITELLQADEDLNQLADVLDILGAIGGSRGNPPFPRGDGIVQLLCERSNISEDECIPLRLFGAAIIEEVINDVAPPEVIDVLNVFGDLYRIIAEFQVYGEMEFAASFPDEEGLLLGNESRWQGLRFVWRQDCPFDDVELCTREFSLIDAGVGRRTFSAPFDAQLRDEDVLYVGPHQMRLHLGLLATAVLETWILPQIINVEGPVSFNQFFSLLLSCEDINTALPPFIPNSGVCEATIVQPLAELMYQQLESIGSGADLFTFEGTVNVVDLLPDLRVDRLNDGIWNASFGDEEVLIERMGTFEGCRLGQCPADLEAQE